MKIKDSTGQWIEIPGLQGPQGLQGLQGPQGVSISSIEKTSANGLVDTYTITLSNGNTDTFTVTNGSPGQAGQPGQDGLTTSITLNGGSYNVDGSGDIALPALIPTSQIKDNLTSTSGVLNANQGRVLKGQVDGKFPLYTQMISNAPDFAYITSLPPGSYGWIQTGRLDWEPDDVPGGSTRCNLSIEAHSSLTQWVCHLNLIDGSTNGREFIGEWNSGRDYIRWAENITSKQKGAANGVASLGADGKLAAAQVPGGVSIVSWTGTGTYGEQHPTTIPIPNGTKYVLINEINTEDHTHAQIIVGLLTETYSSNSIGRGRDDGYHYISCATTLHAKFSDGVLSIYHTYSGTSHGGGQFNDTGHVYVAICFS